MAGLHRPKRQIFWQKIDVNAVEKSHPLRAGKSATGAAQEGDAQLDADGPPDTT